MDARIRQTDSDDTHCDGCNEVGDYEMWWRLNLFDSHLWLCPQCAEILGVLLLKERLLGK